MARLTGRAAAIAAVLTAAACLAACGGGTNSDALAACHGIRVALGDYSRSLHAPTARAKAADDRAIEREIALVQEDAADANSQDGSYDALMTQLQEAEQEPFANVADALRASCNSITSTTSYL